MLVVSDATPVNILVTLAQDNLLPALFQTVVIPPSVLDELSRPSPADSVHNWVIHPPPWLKIQSPVSQLPAGPSRHRGERDAIQLALELKADAILLDEHMARVQATKLGLRVIGTIGLLEQAANKGLISDLSAVYDQLRKSWFYVALTILTESLTRHRTWRKNHPEG